MIRVINFLLIFAPIFAKADYALYAYIICNVREKGDINELETYILLTKKIFFYLIKTKTYDESEKTIRSGFYASRSMDYC